MSPIVTRQSISCPFPLVFIIFHLDIEVRMKMLHLPPNAGPDSLLIDLLATSSIDELCATLHTKARLKFPLGMAKNAQLQLQRKWRDNDNVRDINDQEDFTSHYNALTYAEPGFNTSVQSCYLQATFRPIVIVAPAALVAASGGAVPHSAARRGTANYQNRPRLGKAAPMATEPGVADVAPLVVDAARVLKLQTKLREDEFRGAVLLNQRTVKCGMCGEGQIIAWLDIYNFKVQLRTCIVKQEEIKAAKAEADEVDKAQAAHDAAHVDNDPNQARVKESKDALAAELGKLATLDMEFKIKRVKYKQVSALSLCSFVLTCALRSWHKFLIMITGLCSLSFHLSVRLFVTRLTCRPRLMTCLTRMNVKRV